MYEFLSGTSWRRAPGEYEYSNYGMGLLGYVLAKPSANDVRKAARRSHCEAAGHAGYVHHA